MVKIKLSKSHELIVGIFSPAILSLYLLIEYLQGLTNHIFIIGSWFPVGLICLFSLVIVIIWGSIIAIVSIINKEVPIAIFIGAIISILTILIAQHLPSAFLMGFKNYVISRISADEIREIELKSKETLFVDDFLPGPGKQFLWNDKIYRKWDVLSRSTNISKLDSGMVISRKKDYVAIIWGGALVGHWAIIISNDDVVNWRTNKLCISKNIKVAFYD